MPAHATAHNTLVFTLDDPGRALARVGLDCDDAITGPRRFRRTATGWALTIPQPDLSRVEYRLVVTSRGGDTTVICDPGTTERVATAFGDRSVALLPGYESPQWLTTDAEQGAYTHLTHHDTAIGDLPVTVWSPAGLPPGSPAHLLVAHDGPEYDNLAHLCRYAAAAQASDTIPAFRVALMHPVHREEWYAGNADYVAAELEAIDTVEATYATLDGTVVMGASLGGLCALLVTFAAQPKVGGLFVQSGSFFTPELDAQESSYPHFGQVTGAVRAVAASRHTHHPLQVGMTCGEHEENYANNLAMQQVLTGHGHHVQLRPLKDLHSYTAWRDALEPALTSVLRSCWGARG